MQFGNTNLSYIYNQFKKLLDIKIPLYYVPALVSLWYYPKETLMVGTSYFLFINLDQETTRRNDDPEYNTRLWEEENSDDEEDTDGQQIEEEDTDGQQIEEEVTEANSDVDSALTNSPEDEDYNLVDENDSESVNSKTSQLSDDSIWKYFRY